MFIFLFQVPILFNIHDSDGFYRSLWYDPNNQRLYLERGNW